MKSSYKAKLGMRNPKLAENVMIGEPHRPIAIA